MSTWDQAHAEWRSFTDALGALQQRLHCSYRNAWFRGHESPSFQLMPSGLRLRRPPGFGKLATLSGGRGPEAAHLRDVRAPLAIDGLVLGEVQLGKKQERRFALSPDAAVVAEEEGLETDIRSAIRDTRAELLRAANSWLLARNELDQLSKSLVPVKGAQLDPGYRASLLSHQREVKFKLSDLCTQVSALRQRILGLRSIFYGERDLFLAFRQRASVVDTGSSSWLALAAMQHHGVPTRLLDWSTSAGIALYFALKGVRERMVEKCGNVPNWLEVNSAGPRCDDFEDLPKPTVWILNPFLLARRTASLNRIEDPTIRPDWDYLRCFHDNASWPFNGCVPVVIPWRSERILAQRGVFTIHGRDTRALDEQVAVTSLDSEARPGAILGRIELPLLAALFAVRHVVQFIGLDTFSVFRGEDSNGRDAKERFR